MVTPRWGTGRKVLFVVLPAALFVVLLAMWVTAYYRTQWIVGRVIGVAGTRLLVETQDGARVSVALTVDTKYDGLANRPVGLGQLGSGDRVVVWVARRPPGLIALEVRVRKADGRGQPRRRNRS